MKKFLEAYEEEEAKQQEQKKLHIKHDIKDESIVIVEKSNLFQFSVRSIGNIIRMGTTVLLLCLAAIGLLCIIYPETRHPLEDVAAQIFNQLTQFFKGERL